MKGNKQILIVLVMILVMVPGSYQEQNKPNAAVPSNNNNNKAGQEHLSVTSNSQPGGTEGLSKNMQQTNEATKTTQSSNIVSNTNSQPTAQPPLEPLSQHHKLNLTNLLNKAKQIGVLNSTQLHAAAKKINDTISSMPSEQRTQYIKQLTKNMEEAYLSYQKIHQKQQQKQELQVKQYQLDQLVQSMVDSHLQPSQQPQQPQQSPQHQPQPQPQVKIASRTQQYKLKQRNKVKQHFKSHKSDFLGAYNSYSFIMQHKSIADFRIEVPTNQRVVMTTHIYVNKDGSYDYQGSAEDSQELNILIYQNKHRLIYQNRYYFQDIVAFNVTANSSYLIRFNNPGKHRMVFLTTQYILETHHVENTLSGQHGYKYQSRIDGFKSNFERKLLQSKEKMLLQDQNQGVLLGKLGQYYYFTIVEIVFIGILCVIQVECIKKMLDHSVVI